MKSFIGYFMSIVLVAVVCVSATDTFVNAAEGVTKVKQNSDNYWVYFGTGGGQTPAMKEMNVPASEGVYVTQFNSADGTVSKPRLAAKMLSSGFLTIDQKRQIMYIAGTRQAEDGKANVCAYKIDAKTGNLTYLNHQGTGGAGVCHIALSPDGKFLAAANYSSGDFALFPVEENGKIGPLSALIKKPDTRGPDVRRQDGPKGHAVYFVEYKGQYRLFMCDLGCDKVYIGLIDRKTGKIQDDPEIPVLKCPPGSGPRHLAWMKNANDELVVFVLNELDSTMSVFGLRFDAADSKKALRDYGTWTTIPEELREKLTDEVNLVDGKKYTYGNKTAEIEFFQPGKTPIVYASNRGHNSIAVFDVREFVKPGTAPKPELTQLQHTFGTFPRYFSTDPTGKFLFVCNKRTGTVYLFTIDHESGHLEPVNTDPIRIAFAITMGFVPVK